MIDELAARDQFQDTIDLRKMQRCRTVCSIGPRAPRLVLVVNDGLRQKLKMNGGWSVRSLREIVERNGNAVLYRDYLAICRELVIEKAAKAGYGLRRWTGYYCGSGQQMSHYAAVLER